LLPLQDIKLIDLSRLGPGPFCTMLLGDLGAEIIRVEEFGPPTGRRAAQVTQGKAELVDTGHAQPRLYNAIGRNKRSIALNLKDPAAREILYRLVEEADVFLEGFRPGVAERLGVDYPRLSALNPRLIYCSLTGYGQTGPKAQLPGHDINYIGAAGALGSWGDAEGRPVLPLNLVGDFGGGGMMAAVGILAALHARTLTGRGQYVDVAMTDGVLGLMAMFVSNYFAQGEVPRPYQHPLNGARPQYTTYRCADGQWLCVGALEPWFYENLCRALGRPDLLTLRQDNPAERQQIFEAFAAAFAQRPRAEWLERLADQDVCVAPVYTLDEALADPHNLTRAMVIEVVDEEGNRAKQIGFPIKFSETQPAVRRLAPSRRGEHTREILHALGYDDATLERLAATGAIAL
jgi:crotonobetainyl-CoA:carnitine CoA-transferase CaiB-like acyl-CoA transferase